MTSIVQSISQFFREYLLAVQFFTRLPITGRLADWVGYSPELLRASAGHFPGVGVLAGAVAAAVYALLQALLLTRLAGVTLEDATGRGTGLNDQQLLRKREVLRRALARHPLTQPLDAMKELAALGGFEIAMMAGAMLQAASERRVVLEIGRAHV